MGTSGAAVTGAARPRRALVALALVAAGALLALAAAVAPREATAQDLEAPAGQEWREIHFFLDATGSFFHHPCSGSYFGIGVVTCDGSYTDGTGTPPFNGGDGTITMVHNFDSPLFMTIYHQGAQLDGSIPNDDSSPRLSITSGVTSWGKGIHSGNAADIAAGEKGGPLYIDVEADYGYSFRVHGWVLYEPTGLGEPPVEEATTTTEAGDPAAEEAEDGGEGEAPAAVVRPRFTG